MGTKNFNNNVNGNINTNLVSNQNTIQNTPQNIDWEGNPWMERKPSHPERIITIGSSCSGIGAMEHAIEGLGLRSFIQFAGDIDSNVKKSYFANYPITEDRWHNNLFEFAKSDLSKYKDKISIFMAGICCQPFSKAGKLEGIKDPIRGSLFEPFIEVVHQIQPAIWIIENVDNMLTIHDGWDWSVIKSHLDKLGYDIHYQILNALDYGLPQNRNRLFVIGFKEPNPDFKFPAPVELNKCIRDYLIDTTPAFRRLYPREALNLQGFSEDFKMEVPEYAIYHQAGNSIAVPVLKAIFSQIDLTKYGFDPEELGLEVEEPVRSGYVEDYVEDNKPVIEDMKEMEISKSTPMTILDLKSEMETLKSEIEERQSKLDKLVSEFENRRNEVVNNWKQHMKQKLEYAKALMEYEKALIKCDKVMMEDTKVMIEMGIDPSTLSFDEMELSGDTIPVSDNTETESTIISDEKEDDTTYETVVESETIEPVVCECMDVKEPTFDSEDSSDDTEPRFLTPYFILYGLDKTKKAKRKENINPITGKRMVSKFYTPYFELYEDSVKNLMKIGNLKYKKSYPDPEESRVMSADGYSPTLTFTHSDLYTWIGPKYDENGNRITPSTPVIENAA